MRRRGRGDRRVRRRAAKQQRQHRCTGRHRDRRLDGVARGGHSIRHDGDAGTSGINQQISSIDNQLSAIDGQLNAANAGLSTSEGDPSQ